MAVFGTFDPQMICTAHANQARVVIAADFDLQYLRDLEHCTQWYVNVTQVCCFFNFSFCDQVL
jgi:hypothetical protein